MAEGIINLRESLEEWHKTSAGKSHDEMITMLAGELFGLKTVISVMASVMTSEQKIAIGLITVQEMADILKGMSDNPPEKKE